MDKQHAGLKWMREHVPIFAKMCADTEQRKQSEAEYRKMKDEHRPSA